MYLNHYFNGMAYNEKLATGIREDITDLLNTIEKEMTGYQQLINCATS
jgi:hypothetical protein